MKVLIDISNITPGKGGSGGGVAIYANKLLEELDSLMENSSYKIYCFKNKDNNNIKYRNIKVIQKSYNTSNFLIRLLWLNIYLPFYCLNNRITVLHRVVPEMPIIKTTSYICTLHDLMYRYHLKKSYKRLNLIDKIKSHVYGIIIKISVSISDYILVPSDFIQSEVIEVFNLKSSKIETTYNGVSIEALTNKAFNSSKGKFKFIVVAGFYPHKGHIKVLELAEAFINNNYYDFSITFRGNSFDLDLITTIKNEIKKKKLEDYISFDDFQKSHDLRKIYEAYDALLLLSEYEGFGLPVLEAQAFEKPVICSDIEIFREVLMDSAVFIDTNNINNASIQIINIIRNESFLKNLVKKGVLNTSRFSWKNTAQQTFSAYKRFSKDIVVTSTDF